MYNPREGCNLKEAAPFSWEQSLVKNSAISYLQAALEHLMKGVSKSFKWVWEIGWHTTESTTVHWCYGNPPVFSIKFTPSGDSSFLLLWKLTEWRLTRQTAALASAAGHGAVIGSSPSSSISQLSFASLSASITADLGGLPGRGWKGLSLNASQTWRPESPWP